jgi:hypothetical protein
MAPFHPPTSGTAGHRRGGRLLTRLRTHNANRSSVSNEDAPEFSASHSPNPRAESNDTPRSSLGTLLSRFHVGRRDANEQPNPTTKSSQTDAGMVEHAPLESEPEPSRSPQQTSQNADTKTETTPQPLSWLVDQLASSDTRAGASSSEHEDSSSDSLGDDANSHHTELISDDEGDAEDVHHYFMLGAYDPNLKQPVFFFGTGDTGAAVSVLSYAKARFVAPDGISDNFAHVGTRTLDILGGEVTVHGPIWVKFWLRSKGSRIRYKAPFYVLPTSYGESGFDALLNHKVVERLGLVEIQRDPAA